MNSDALILRALMLLLWLEYWGKFTQDSLKEYDDLKKDVKQWLTDNESKRKD